MIDAKTEVLGLLAHSVEHSLSPLLQNTLATVCGENVMYLPFEVKNPEELGVAICDAHALGITGLNVTVPYKEAVIPHLCGLSEEARLIGVVGTLVWTEEDYVGYNTDIVGMATMFARRNLRMEGMHILLFDAGSAARSAAMFAVTGGTAELVILNRNTARTGALAKAVRDINPFSTARTAALEHRHKLPSNDYLYIQCTSISMWPDTEETIVEDPRFFKKFPTVADIVYTLEETKLPRLTCVVGKPVAGGLVILTSQGVRALSLWTGKWCTAEQEKELLTFAKGALPAQEKAEKGL